MFFIKKFKPDFCKKILPPFAAAFVLGVALNTFFGRYTISYSITETFTRSEAESLLHERLSAKCFEKPGVRMATVVSYQKNKFTGVTDLVVEFDEALLGRFKIFTIDKVFFEKCIDVLEK